MVRTIFPLLALLLLGSCSFFDKKEETPAYLHIKKFSVTTNSGQGSNSNNINDVWVIVNGNTIGVFELPCTIPILEEGDCDIILFAGIKDDGIAAIRKVYPFYTNYVESKFLVRGTVDTISPTCTYFDVPMCNINKEEFEDAGVKFVPDASSTGTVVKTNVVGEVFEGSFSGKIEMNSTDFLVKAFYTPNLYFPGNGLQAYVELDYKNNIEFTIGLEVTEPSNILQTDNTIITPSYDDSDNLIWKKIYVNLTELVNLHPNATNYRVFVKAVNPDALNGQVILLDNFKVVYAN